MRAWYATPVTTDPVVGGLRDHAGDERAVPVAVIRQVVVSNEVVAPHEAAAVEVGSAQVAAIARGPVGDPGVEHRDGHSTAARIARADRVVPCALHSDAERAGEVPLEAGPAARCSLAGVVRSELGGAGDVVGDGVHHERVRLQDRRGLPRGAACDRDPLRARVDRLGSADTRRAPHGRTGALAGPGAVLDHQLARYVRRRGRRDRCSHAGERGHAGRQEAKMSQDRHDRREYGGAAGPPLLKTTAEGRSIDQVMVGAP